MIKSIEKELAALPEQAFRGIQRGLERECLRVSTGGQLTATDHPRGLGAALTHPQITTDYGEDLLEFITPVNEKVEDMLNQMADIHRYTVRQLENQSLWPTSMPCDVADPDQIRLADYGVSNVGQLKHTYRQGLKNRYGSMMQIIAGVHYNFSLPQSFWQFRHPSAKTPEQLQSVISEGYMGLIRNFYRYGWLIPYLYGASPAIKASFLNQITSTYPFEPVGDSRFLPYATSLRMSDLGYTNDSDDSLLVCHNSLDSYVSCLRTAIHTHSEKFAKIGVKVDGHYRQLNDNVLQIENELYAPIRPKRVTQSLEKPVDALEQRGIEYIEIRSLDVNPFSPVGITAEQIHFLDAFLTTLALLPSPEMSLEEMSRLQRNFDRVVVEGRRPGLELELDGEKIQLSTLGNEILESVAKVAAMLDQPYGEVHHSQAVSEQIRVMHNPELTLSARWLNELKQTASEGKSLPLEYAKRYQHYFETTDYQFYDQAHFAREVEKSFLAQQAIEQTDRQSFDQFLHDYFLEK